MSQHWETVYSSHPMQTEGIHQPSQGSATASNPRPSNAQSNDTPFPESHTRTLTCNPQDDEINNADGENVIEEEEQTQVVEGHDEGAIVEGEDEDGDDDHEDVVLDEESTGESTQPPPKTNVVLSKPSIAEKEGGSNSMRSDEKRLHQEGSREVKVNISPSRSESATYKITGMTCGSCVSFLEGQLKGYPGVIKGKHIYLLYSFVCLLVCLHWITFSIRYSFGLQTFSYLACYYVPCLPPRVSFLFV